MRCLFSDVLSRESVCSGESAEHLIQMCLGGRHKSSQVICANCNRYFGDNIDPGLCEVYSTIIDAIRPMMPSQFTTIQRTSVSADKSVPLLVREGGIVQLRISQFTYRNDGSVESIYLPGHWSHRKRQEYLKAKRLDKFTKQSVVPLTDITPSAISKRQFVFGASEYRAIVKSILEIFDWYCQECEATNYARGEQLRQAREFVRLGIRGEFITSTSSPLYSLENECREIFASRHEFSNKVLIANDVNADRIFALIQIANTMPIGVCLGHALPRGTFTILYEAGLLRNSIRSIKYHEKLFVSFRDFKWAAFSFLTKQGNEFAWWKFRESMSMQLGRATMLLDLRDDERISGLLYQHGIVCLQESSEPIEDLLLSILLPILKLRFQHQIQEHDIRQNLLYSARLSGIDTRILANDLKQSRSFGAQKEQIISCYRDSLRRLAKAYGYPRVLFAS